MVSVISNSGVSIKEEVSDEIEYLHESYGLYFYFLDSLNILLLFNS